MASVESRVIQRRDTSARLPQGETHDHWRESFYVRAKVVEFPAQLITQSLQSSADE